MQESVLDSPVGIVFWTIAVVALVAAIGSVTIKKRLFALASTTITTFTVGALLIFLGYYGIAVLYLVLIGSCSIIFLAQFKKQTDPSGHALDFGFNPRPILNVVLGVIIFSGILYIIAHTDIWQYELSPVKSSFTEIVSGFFEKYLATFVHLAAFILIFALLFVSVKRKGNA